MRIGLLALLAALPLVALEPITLAPGGSVVRTLPEGAVLLEPVSVETALHGADTVQVVTSDLHAPYDLAFGADGGLYVADTLAGQIVRIGESGRHELFFKPDEPFFPCALAFDDEGGLYVADQRGGRVLYLDRNGTQVDTLLEGELEAPCGVAVDRGGGIYISDSKLHRIWHLADRHALPRVFAGQGELALMHPEETIESEQLSLRHPRHLAIGQEGHLYVADYGNNRILRIDQEGVASVVAGPARGQEIQRRSIDRALINRPFSLAFSPEGELHFSDHLSHSVARIHQGRYDRLIGTMRPGSVVGETIGRDAPLYYPRGVAFCPRSGALYVADYLNDQVLRLHSGRTVTITAPEVEGNYTLEYRAEELSGGWQIAVKSPPALEERPAPPVQEMEEPAREETSAQEVPALPPIPSPLRPIITEAQPVVALERPVSLLPRGDALLLASQSEGLFQMEADGTLVPLPASAEIQEPLALARDAQGGIYLADRGRHQVLHLQAEGWQPVAGSGTIGFLAHEREAKAARLNHPNDVALDEAGNLYIADRGNHFIQRVDPQGEIAVIAGSGEGGSSGYSGDGGPAVEAQLNQPTGVAVDSSRQLLYIADYANHAVRQVDLVSGVITTLAGTGEAGFSGDGGLAHEAQLNHPYRVRLLPDGRLLVADARNNRIRQIALDGTISTLFGDGSEQKLYFPTDITLQGEKLLISDFSGGRVIAIEGVLEPDVEVIE